MKVTRYKGGELFEYKLAKDLDRWADYCYNRGFPVCILIDGVSNGGKTTLAVEMADYLQGRPIKLKEHIALGGQELVKKSLQAPAKGHKVIIYDEAGDFSSKGALTRFNKSLHEYFQKYRYLRIILILTIPRFWHIDKVLLEQGVLQALIHIYGDSKTYREFKIYDQSQIWYIKSAISQRKITELDRCYIFGTPNYHGNFKDIEDPARRKELAEIGAGRKSKDLTELFREQESIKEKGVTIQDLAGVYNVKVQSMRDKLTGLKAIGKVGKRAYYDLKEVKKHLEAK